MTAGHQHQLPRSESDYLSPDLGYKITWDRDVMIPMRDGVKLCGDVYRPGADGRFPALLAIAPHNKELQNPEQAAANPPQPAWSSVWQGSSEGGDTDYFVSRGYAHIVCNPRGVGKSQDGGDTTQDLYDLIEWIGAQPWCDGNVGMVGLSAFAANQWNAAMLQPPSLKAIFPFDAMPAYGAIHDRYPGGVIHVMLHLLHPQSVVHGGHGIPGELPPEQDAWWRDAMANPDNRMYSWVYNLLGQKGQIEHRLFGHILDPFEKEGNYEKSEADFAKIKIPAYTGAGWHSYTYKMHLNGSQNWFNGIDVPKKLVFTGLAHMERPFHSLHDEMLRWYDYWLKGIDTGIMNEPTVNYWVLGENRWRSGSAWPLPETKFTDYYLHSWERLRDRPFVSGSRDVYNDPDSFVQMPPTQTRKIEKLRYLTEPFADDTLIAGPIGVSFFASIDQEDVVWIAAIRDVGPDVSVRTGRDNEWDETEVPSREISRGWLKASYRELDEKRTKPWKPWHKLTREANKKVVPGEINEYQIEICSTANMFKKGHRLCLEIMTMDMPSGSGYGHSCEYVPYHICSSKTTVTRIYHNAQYPSKLVLPIVPTA